jgi:hypothetical protein
MTPLTFSKTMTLHLIQKCKSQAQTILSDKTNHKKVYDNSFLIRQMVEVFFKKSTMSYIYERNEYLPSY